MANTALQSPVLKFGTFELDLAAGELRKNGRKVRLQEQPFQLLTALIEKPGEVVTREELKDRLWPGDTYVDFDRSLNTAASKLRDALGDSASSPRFIETLPRRGYRFLASIDTAGSASSSDAKSPDDDPRGWSHREWLVVGLVAATAVAVAAFRLLPNTQDGPTAPPRKLTIELPGLVDAADLVGATISPNGKYIAYASAENRKLAVWDLSEDDYQVLEGTDRAFIPFWSPDSASIGFWSESGEIKRVPARGGAVTTVAEEPACCPMGTWSLDGQSIVYSRAGEIFEVSAGGGQPVMIPSPKGHTKPYFLPVKEGRYLLLYGRSTEESSGRHRLVLLDIDSDHSETLAEFAGPLLHHRICYSASGHIVLWAPKIRSLPSPSPCGAGR